jgi:hypothetical protein
MNNVSLQHTLLLAVLAVPQDTQNRVLPDGALFGTTALAPHSVQNFTFGPKVSEQQPFSQRLLILVTQAILLPRDRHFRVHKSSATQFSCIFWIHIPRGICMEEEEIYDFGNND